MELLALLLGIVLGGAIVFFILIHVAMRWLEDFTRNFWK